MAGLLSGGAAAVPVGGGSRAEAADGGAGGGGRGPREPLPPGLQHGEQYTIDAAILAQPDSQPISSVIGKHVSLATVSLNLRMP